MSYVGNDLSRRSFLMLTATAVLSTSLVTSLSGCGGNGRIAEVSGETRIAVDIDDREVSVPVNPQRIVTLSEPTLDGALALGVIPVGTASGRGQSAVPNYLADLAGEVPIVSGVANPNYEEIAKVSPDLILVDGTSINNNQEILDILSAIAPLVYTGYAGGDWRLNFQHVADALNLQDRADEVMASYDAHVAAVKEQLAPYAESTFSIARWQGNSAALILKELPPGQALEDLGLKRPENQDRRGRGHSEPVSLENISEIDADYIFFGTLGGSSVTNTDAGGSADLDGAQDALAEAIRTPGFTDLKAYKEKHIILVDGSLWTSTGGPFLMNRIVDAVEEALV